MKHLIIALVTMISSASFAAPRCLNLSAKQAQRAVHLAKKSLYKGGTMWIESKKETGFLKPNGVWSEVSIQGKGKNKRALHQVRVDGRIVDISLIYLSKKEDSTRAYNWAWLSGCRPAADKPLVIRTPAM